MSTLARMAMAGFVGFAALMSVTDANALIVDPTTPNWISGNETSGGGADFFGFVSGPGTPPGGNGSFRMTLDNGADGVALFTPQLRGTRLDELTALTYNTYQASNLGPQAIAFQFNIDYDVTDADLGWQGRLVFEPINTAGNVVQSGVWQNWDALAGNWWSTGFPGKGVCPQGSPCSIATILASFPNAGVHATLGGFLFKAGSGWPVPFDGNVDLLTIGINGQNSVYDFEPIPEPGTLGLLSLAGVAIAGLRRRKRA